MSRDCIIIGTRGSELARTQTATAADSITAATGIRTETVIIRTQGDRVQDVPFHQMDGKGFFTKELEEALLDGRIDLAVHSLKDLPTQNPPGLVIAAVPLRAPAHDLLLIRDASIRDESPYGLPQKPIIGTSAKRRALQIKGFCPDAQIKELRGNVPTRVRKLVEGGYDAIVIAAAGFQRLGMSAQGYRMMDLDFDTVLPAPGQGALALQARAGDAWLIESLRPLHHAPTAFAVETERAVLELLGGGCGMPLGIIAEYGHSELRVRALLGPQDWQFSDSFQGIRAQAVGRSPFEAAQRTLDALGIHSER